MKLGRVTGAVVCSHLEDSLRGERLLVVQPLDERHAAAGNAIVACDTVQSGPGDIVVWEGGREAAMALRRSYNLSDAAIIAVVDRTDRESPP